MNIEKTSNDTYLKSNKLKSEIIDSYDILENSLSFNLYSDNLSYEDIKIDIKSHKVYRKNNLIKLSPKEYDLLVNFVINPKLV